MTMRIIEKIDDMKTVVQELKAQNRTVGFVPTMGYLHEGHLSLVRASINKADFTIVSIFVNPTQFGPLEDLQEYPRDFSRDAELLRKEGVDLIFHPEVEEIYPQGFCTYVEVHGLQNKLCGKTRPLHFRGVCTVVLKLLNIIGPDFAFFGQKDAQQSIIIKRMIRDLHLDIKIDVQPIVRDKDGLALSSRNSYLDADQRKAALVLSRSLNLAREMIEKGERNSGKILEVIKNNINSESKGRLDYAEIVSLENLEPVAVIKPGTLIALAVFIDKIRLIDNLIIRTEDM